MTGFPDSCRNSRQPRNSLSPSLSPSAAAIAGSGASISAASGGGNAFNSSRPRIYPREFNSRHPAAKSPHLSATSPLLSAFQNSGDLLARSLPFNPFLSTPSPSPGATHSLGSVPGGAGLGVGPSPPPSAPASYSSGGFGGPRPIRGYPLGEEQYAGNGTPQGYHRYAQASPVPSNGQLGNRTQLYPGDGNFACTFDTLDEPGFAGDGGFGGAAIGVNGGGGDNVVCLGWDGGVDVWRIGRGVVDLVGRLEGLGGRVKSAKILPNPPLNDPFAAHRPLICLTIHSSVRPPPVAESAQPPPIVEDTETPYSTSPPSRPRTATSDKSPLSPNSPAQPADWQTTVELWSLSTRTKVAKLFSSPEIPAVDFGIGIGGPPPLWGGLKIEVAGNKVVVGVGLSGEVYLFGPESKANGSSKKKGGKEDIEWRCLGKVWTAVQVHSGGGFSGDSGMSGMLGGDPRSPSLNGYQTATPVFSLSDRWLAYCPASAGSSFSAGGEVNVPYTCPTVASKVPPAQPPISAAMSLEDEAFLNRMAREVTQEVIRGAKWATEAGLKAFQNYWNGSSQSSGSPPPPAPPLPVNTNGGLYGFPNGSIASMQGGQHGGLGQQLRQHQQMGGLSQQPPYFQPTTYNQSTNEPRLVSLVDLAKIQTITVAGGVTSGGAQKAISAMATFLPPAGVSFLSFSPGGLALLTASLKGDLLSVWDLMRAVHHPPNNGPLGHQKSGSISGNNGQDGNKGANPAAALGKHVRQIAKFTRITVATIVDVNWSSPRGDKLAVVTERGTVHFYDLPSGAYQWPPPRRPPPSSSAMSGGTAGGAAGAAVSGAVNLLNSSTQPLLTAARRRGSRSDSVGSSNGIFMNLAGSATRRGGPNNRSRSDSPNEPTSESKIALPQGLGNVTPGCVRFLIGKERGYVAVMGCGVLRIYEVRSGGSGGRKKRKNGGGIVPINWVEYDLPILPDGPSQQFTVEGEEAVPGCYYGGRHHPHGHHRSEEQNKYDQHPLSFAEIETNAAFPPFHADHHVGLFVYTDSGSNNQLPQQGNDWQHDESKQDTQHRRLPNQSSISGSTSQLQSSQHAEQEADPVVEAASDEKWVFGLPLPAERLNIGSARGEVKFESDEAGLAEAMANELSLSGLENELKKRKGMSGFVDEEGFFEGDDCELLEYTV